MITASLKSHGSIAVCYSFLLPLASVSDSNKTHTHTGEYIICYRQGWMDKTIGSRHSNLQPTDYMFCGTMAVTFNSNENTLNSAQADVGLLSNVPPVIDLRKIICWLCLK